MQEKLNYMTKKVDSTIMLIHKRLNFFMLIDVILAIQAAVFITGDLSGGHTANYLILHLVGHSIAIVLALACCFLNAIVFNKLMESQDYHAILKDTEKFNEELEFELESAQLAVLDASMRILNVVQYFTCAVLCLFLLALC